MIICAAMKVVFNDNKHPTIICCRRHGDFYQMIKDMGFSPKSNYKVLEQGFVTHSGAFLNRVDAYEYAKASGQLSASTLWYKEDHGDKELYSEDLY